MVSRIEVPNEDVALALDGDARAIERIVRALERPFYALARRMSLSAEDAEEATQEALLRVLTHLSQFDGRAQFSTWAWRIAVNQCLDHRAKRRKLPVLSSEAISEQIASGLDLEAPERTEDRAVLNELKASCAIAMLSVLDLDQRVAFVLGDVLELSGDEAADVLAIDAAAYRKRLSRARAALREALSANCGMIDPSNACRCHRRVDAARARSLLDRERVDSEPLSQQRAALAALDEAARIVALYRADVSAMNTRRDLAQRVVATLRTTHNPRA
ncbi:MAG: RNA polymerase sigma factor [Polyangiales bacterium]